MSGETPAAHLARLRTQYQGWRIERSGTRSGFAAHRGEERLAPNFVYAPTLGELEAALWKQVTRRGGDQ